MIHVIKFLFKVVVAFLIISPCCFLLMCTAFLMWEKKYMEIAIQISDDFWFSKKTEK